MRHDIRGFTLLEVMIGIGIIIIIVTAALVALKNSRDAQNLATTRQNIISTLRLAQARSIAGTDDDTWGVHLAQSSYTLFRGANFAAATFTQVAPLPPRIEIALIALAGGGQDIIFNRVDGATNQSGTFSVRLVSSPSGAFSVTADASGRAYITTSIASALNTRIVDARHRSFNLGWSIRGAMTLTLTFIDPPNPNVVQPVAMVNYFNAGQTIFDWSGTVAVNGDNQMLRVHTNSLDSVNTIFSIDHDCWHNNKKLTVAIDGKLIATYEADCATVTVGGFGGVMSEQ